MKTFISVMCTGLLLAGCQASHLVYVHETSVGMDVAVSTEGTGRMVFGYDRDTYSIVPRKGDGKDAMALVSMSCIRAHGLDDVDFRHFVTSGKAAVNLAKSKSETLKGIKQAVQGGGEKCSAQ